jgi:hypothetical protein
MDAAGFDALARALTAARSRRRALALLLSGAVGSLGGLETAAKKKRKKKRKKKPSPTPPPPPDGTSPPPPSPPPTCTDGITNGGETDVDCGGPTCPPCLTGQTCASGRDCQTGRCLNGVCHKCFGANACGHDVAGQCTCIDGYCLTAIDFSVASCAGCPEHWYCGSDCKPFCGSSESCLAVYELGAPDACQGNTAPCGHGGLCYQTIADPSCGIPAVPALCDCNSNEECVDAYGPGAFCAIITGPSCPCNGAHTFCATPA